MIHAVCNILDALGVNYREPQACFASQKVAFTFIPETHSVELSMSH